METVLLFLAAGAYTLFALYRLELAVIGLAAFFPLYLVKGAIAGIPVTLIEMLIYGTAIAFVVRRVRDFLSPESWFSAFFSSIRGTFVPRVSFLHQYKYFLVGVGLMVVAAFLSLTVTQSELVLIDGQIFQGMRTALGILKGWIIAPVVYLLLLLATIRTTRQSLNVLNAYSVSAFVLALLALYQVITQDYITPDLRASGPFENANYLALFIAPALLYGLVRLREFFAAKDLQTTPASLFLVGTIVLFLALMASKSYAGLLAFFVAAVFYFGFQYWYGKRKGRFPWKFLLGGLGVLLLGLVAIYIVDPMKWEAMFQFAERNSSSVRIQVYTIAWGLIADNWLMGIGMGQFPALYQIEAVKILGYEPFEWNMLHPHNVFLAMWLNLGLLGLVAFVGVLAVCLQRAWDSVKIFATEKITGIHKIRVLAFSLLLIIFVHGFFDTPFFKNDLALLFWAVVGILMAVKDDR